MTNQTDIDALVTALRPKTRATGRRITNDLARRAADALESTAAELRQERERAEAAERALRATDDYRVADWQKLELERDEAEADLTRAQAVIEKALAITDNANISGHHWMLRDTRNVLATYEKGAGA